MVDPDPKSEGTSIKDVFHFLLINQYFKVLRRLWGSGNKLILVHIIEPPNDNSKMASRLLLLELFLEGGVLVST